MAFPNLTKVGVSNLINHLNNSDVAVIQNSSNPMKTQIETQINALVSRLKKVLNTPGNEVDPSTWNQPDPPGSQMTLKRQIKDLTSVLSPALRLANNRPPLPANPKLNDLSADDVVACRYDDDCFETTKAQCQAVGGTATLPPC
jgi:hypothetical protein